MLEHLSELVVKEVHGSGGYGMLVGPTASADEIEMFRMLGSKRAPTDYIAQPTLALSTAPTLVEAGSRAAMSICGRSCWSATACGSLRAATRVALQARARWWSTPARAAAPRTPGCWQD